MPKICLYFQIHQPGRLKNISVFDIGKQADSFYEDDTQNKNILEKVTQKCYSPMLDLLEKLIHEEPHFSASFSVTGIVLEQLEHYSPSIIKSLQRLSRSQQIEFLGETYYHSLASLYSPDEFVRQINLHREIILRLFGQSPTIFRNTELIYTNHIAEIVKSAGFKGMLAEGADRILNGRRPTRLYQSPCGLPLLLKHYLLSDDIAFRFSTSARSHYPLTAETFIHWINSSFADNETVNLFMDFETFGEHQWADTGIFDFFYHFVHQFIASGGRFVTVSQAIADDQPVDVFDSVYPVSWADVDRDITAWRGNSQQYDSLQKIYTLEDQVLKSGNPKLIDDWRKLQTSDHYYYMCTKWAADGDVHAYFSHYSSPYSAYVNFNNALTDLRLRLSIINKHG